MKIGMVGNIGGGLGTRFRELSKTFMRDGHDVHMILKPRSKLLHSVTLLLNTLARSIRKYVKSFELDIIYAMGGIGGKIKEVPVVCHKATSVKLMLQALKRLNPSSLTLKKRINRIYNICVRLPREKRMVRNADCITVACKQGKKIFQSYLNSPRKKSNIKVISGGVNTHHFAPSSRESQGNFSTNTFKVLYVGNMDVLKGLPFLIRALHRLKKEVNEKLECYLVGGKIPSQLKKLINSLNLTNNVKIVGSVPYEEMPTIYSTMDVLVHPSIFEGTPLVIMEAMACGLPVVATDVGATSTFVKKEKTGILISPFSSNAIVDGVLRVKNNPDLRRQMTKKARGLVGAKYDWKVKAKKLEAVFKKLREE